MRHILKTGDMHCTVCQHYSGEVEKIILLCGKYIQVDICRNRQLSKEVGHFEHKFQMEGGVAHQPLLVSEN